MSLTIRRLPSFMSRASRSEKNQVTRSAPQILKKAEQLGAEYIYVCKNKSGPKDKEYYPVSVQFLAKGGKSISRLNLRTIYNP